MIKYKNCWLLPEAASRAVRSNCYWIIWTREAWGVRGNIQECWARIFGPSVCGPPEWKAGLTLNQKDPITMNYTYCIYLEKDELSYDCGATINIWRKRSHCVHQELLYKQSTYRSYSSLMLLFHQEVASSKVTLSLWPGLRHVLSTRQRGNCQEPNGTRKRGLSVERASWSGGSLWEGKASFLGFDWRRHSIWHIWGLCWYILIWFILRLYAIIV